MLIKDFTKWVLIANFIAWPIAWFSVEKWLSSFAYHIDQSITTYITAALLVLVISVLTVGYKALRSAGINPVKAIRYE